MGTWVTLLGDELLSEVVSGDCVRGLADGPEGAARSAESASPRTQ